jgi:hypothetical protein
MLDLSPLGPVVVPIAHNVIHVSAVEDSGQSTDVIIEVAMELWTGRRKLWTSRRSGDITIERLHHSE